MFESQPAIPELDTGLIEASTQERFALRELSHHRPHFLMLDGPVRERSY